MKPEDIAFLYVRVDKSQNRRWLRAAKKDNRTLSSWVRHQLDIAAAKTSHAR